MEEQSTSWTQSSALTMGVIVSALLKSKLNTLPVKYKVEESVYWKKL